MKYLFLAILAMSFSCNSRNVKQNVNRVDDTDIEKNEIQILGKSCKNKQLRQ